MKKNLLPWQLLTVAALVVPSGYLLSVWSRLPPQIPTHFGLNGQANGYTNRDHIWLLTLGLPLGVALLFTILPRFDPKQRLDGNSVNFQKLRLAVVALLGGVACYALHTALQPGMAPGRGIAVLLGLFLALVGNYITTVQPNYFVGIRTPWTLESPAVWTRTNRIGGITFCATGLLTAALALLLPRAWLPAMQLGLMLGTVVFCYAYSYVVFQQEERLRKAL
ncbi:SdpI family protein [Hymenobacter sp. BT664]|uniref:SdpI family protein n=1 Tax=Hymenobacter montanus TaxID=2771359 RepID=A0A927BH16_9BACT|nr:SdpI family protein [Hymenobacter montanus]MBD2769904.1 SdpI family protein [Hymenobacter montanus]